MKKAQIILILIILAFSVAVIMPGVSVLVSPGNQFNVTQDSVFLNYTNNYLTNITVGCMVANCNLNVSNSSTSITPNYTQGSGGTGCSPLVLFVKNATGSYSDILLTAGVNQNISVYFDLTNPSYCNPGRYSGGLRVQNKTDTIENVTINITIDNPISTSNIIGPLTGLGNLSASMQGNATYFHRYYFNTSQIDNATSVLVNLSSSRDLDLFLFDNSNPPKLLAKSINTTGTEQLIYNYIVPNSMYEIRIYGNITNASSTAYNFYVLFSTLNATDSSNTALQNLTLDFGTLNVSQRNIKNITLRNDGNITLSSVSETKEIYYVKRWTSNITTNNLLLVPSFATKIKVAVNWTDQSQNYSLFLRAPDKTLVGSSTNKFVNANFTNASMEEFVETTSISQGFWNITVINNTQPTQNNYTLTAYVWYPVSEWILTNFSDYPIKTFNTTGNANYTFPINITVTIPNNTIDGDFEGFLQYTAASGSALRLPIKVTVNTSSLIVNNTLNSTVVQIDENIGHNTTKVLNITINNTGKYPLSFVITNSSYLFYGGKNISFIFDAPSSLAAGASSSVNITINISTVYTGDTKGVYEGYIFFNSSEARPYQGFNLTLRVNLTDLLRFTDFTITSIDGDSWINQTGVDEIITNRFKVKYLNGTEITELNTTNFTIAWLSNANITYRIPTSGTLTIFNGTSPNIYCTVGCPSGNNYYYVNTTIPANQPGGIYEVHVLAGYNRSDGYDFWGEGVGQYLYINQTGLYMSFEGSPPSSLSNSSSGIVNVSIKNYGPLTATNPKIKLTKGSLISSVSSASIAGAGCSMTTSTEEVTITSIPAYNETGCYVWWSITAGSTAGTTTSYLNGTAGVWFGNLSFSTTVTVPSAETTTTTTPTTTPTTPSVGLKITSYPTETKIQQNTSKSVEIKVNNTGEASLTGVKVYVDGIPLWYTVPSAQDIAVATEKTYTLTFNIPAEAEVKTYDIKYIANNSNTSATVDAKLIVTPSNETQRQIVLNLTNYTSKLNDLSKAINETRARGGNTTVAEEKLKQAEALISQANAYITLGDYNSAYALFSQIDSLLTEADAKLLEAKTLLEQQAGTFWLWVAIGIAAALGIGFVVYMFIPPSHGYEPEVGFKYVPPHARGKPKLTQMQEKIKEIIEKIKNKFKKKGQEGYTYQGRYQLEKEY